MRCWLSEFEEVGRSSPSLTKAAPDGNSEGRVTEDRAAGEPGGPPSLESRSGITILCEPSSPFILRRKLLGLSRLVKYKSRADLWLGLGCLGTNNRLVDAIVFANYEWKYDSEIQILAEQLKGRPMTVAGRKIGRNEPCPCKSGNKFKEMLRSLI